MGNLTVEKCSILIERKQDADRDFIPPYETLLRLTAMGRLRRFLHSRHTLAIELIFWLIFIFFIFLMGLMAPLLFNICKLFDADSLGKIFSVIVSPLLFVASLQFLYTIGAKRRGAVAITLSEIICIARIFAVANIVGDFIQMYSQGKFWRKFYQSGFAGEARKESYLTVFDKNIESFGSLNSVLLDQVTAFYSFLKASRDATGALSKWDNINYSEEKKLSDIIDIIYFCFLSLSSGHVAIKELFEKNDERIMSVEDVLTGLELQCFLFLLLEMDDGDYRYSKLKSRYMDYDDLADKFSYKTLFAVV